MVPVSSFRPQPTLIALLAGGLAMTTGAWAGPRVGEAVGAPTSTTLSVQARVVSATPVIAQVAVPRQSCYDETHEEPHRSSGAGAIIGAIAGGAVGNAIGKGSGKAVTTGAGIIGGAILGDHVENDGRPGQLSTVRRCEQQTGYENRVVAYSVTYEYAGQRFTTQMGQEPGPTIPLQVTLTPAVPGPAPYAQGAPVAVEGGAPVVYEAPPVVYEEPVYGPPHRRGRW